MNYDYSKLLGKIREIFKTQEKYAEALGISSTALNNKLTNKVPFSSIEIDKSILLLHIKNKEIKQYFFTSKVETNSTALEKERLDGN